MSVQGISANANPYLSSTQSSSSNIGSDFQSLAAALQSGNLQSAQSAFSQIQSLMQASQGTTGQQASVQQSQFGKDFAALGKALQSGDLNGAQAALKKLAQDMQSTSKTHRHHHHHGGGAPSQSTTASTTGITAPIGSTSSSGSNVNVLV